MIFVTLVQPGLCMSFPQVCKAAFDVSPRESYCVLAHLLLPSAARLTHPVVLLSRIQK